MQAAGPYTLEYLSQFGRSTHHFLRLRISTVSDRLSRHFLRRGVRPPRLQLPTSRIRPLNSAPPAQRLDVEIYDVFSEKSCPLSILAHLLSTGPISSRDIFLVRVSDLRPMQVIGYLAGVAIVDAYAGGCVLGSGRKLERGRLRRKYHLSKYLLRGERSEIRVLPGTYSTAARVICTAVAAVKKLRVYCERLYIKFVIRTVYGIQQRLRELSIRT